MNISRHQEDFILCCVVMFREREKKAEDEQLSADAKKYEWKIFASMPKTITECSKLLYHGVEVDTKERNRSGLDLTFGTFMLNLVFFFRRSFN